MSKVPQHSPVMFGTPPFGPRGLSALQQPSPCLSLTLFHCLANWSSNSCQTDSLCIGLPLSQILWPGHHWSRQFRLFQTPLGAVLRPGACMDRVIFHTVDLNLDLVHAIYHPLLHSRLIHLAFQCSESFRQLLAINAELCWSKSKVVLICRPPLHCPIMQSRPSSSTSHSSVCCPNAKTLCFQEPLDAPEASASILAIVTLCQWYWGACYEDLRVPPRVNFP